MQNVESGARHELTQIFTNSARAARFIPNEKRLVFCMRPIDANLCKFMQICAKSAFCTCKNLQNLAKTCKIYFRILQPAGDPLDLWRAGVVVRQLQTTAGMLNPHA